MKNTKNQAASMLLQQTKRPQACMKGHFHLGQISSTQLYKFDPCGNVLCMSLKNTHSFGLPENKKDTILLTHYSLYLKIYIYI